MAERRPLDRERLDRLLVARGLASSREQAQALVLAGRVSSGGKPLAKPGMRFPSQIPLEVRPGADYVGRGGTKLAGALRRLAVDAAGRDALDVGASTGGFTQVLLLAGAARVIALDVGRGQLDWKLRTDPRVHVLEGVNARYLEPGQLPHFPSLATVDVSFISLQKVLPPVAACLTPGGEILALVKPQFEVGRREVGRGGIVRDPELHRSVLRRLCDFAAAQEWAVVGLVRSEIDGADGNREFFMHLRPGASLPDPPELGRWIEAATLGGEEAP